MLYAFGHDAQTEVVPQVDDRARDGNVVGVDRHVEYKRLIDLDLVDWQLFQVGE